MAYYNSSLADILNALAAANEEAAPQRFSRFPNRSTHVRQQPTYFAPQEDDDDESSDGGYYSLRYPDYYGNPYFGQSYVPRRQYRRQQVSPQPEQGPTLDDLVSFLMSQGQEGSSSEQQRSQSPSQQPQTVTAAKPAASTATQNKPAAVTSTATPQSATTQSKSQPKPEPKEEKKPLPNPLTHRHSTVNFKEPKPKIEISQRNAKNPALPYSPQTNVYESEKEYTVALAIPGATLSKLDIDFHPSTNEIVVKGTIPEPFGSDSGIKIDEIRTGSVERRIKFPTLPKIVDEQIKAKYQNGLLIIRIPKNNEPDVKPKRKVTIEEVPDEELIWEEKGGVIN